jgi:30S ribosomal protein S31
MCLAFFVTIKIYSFITIKYKIMGRGDIKTKKGKIFSGSFGKTRPSKPAKKVVAAAEEVVEKKKVAKKKA